MDILDTDFIKMKPDVGSFRIIEYGDKVYVEQLKKHFIFWKKWKIFKHPKRNISFDYINVFICIESAEDFIEKYKEYLTKIHEKKQPKIKKAVRYIDK